MRIVTFPTRLPLPALRREVRYTLVQLRLLPWAKPWVKTFNGLLNEIESAAVTDAALTDDCDDAEAAVDYADDELDAVVRRVAATARAVLKGEVLTTFLRSLFGTERPSDFVRPKLGDELARVRTWPTILVEVPVASLQDLVPEVRAAITTADAAEQALTTATAALTAFWSSVHAPLVEKTNGQRKALGGDIKKQAHDAEGGSVHEGLFLTRGGSGTRPARKESIEKTKATIAALQAELTQAQQRLAAQEAQQQAAQQADQKLKELEQRAKELQQARLETENQLTALRARRPTASI